MTGVPALFDFDAKERMEGLRVLVVDDNQTNRRILEEVLKNWGACPELAVDGASALEALQVAAAEDRPFALTLIDGMMPLMDGFELAARIGHSNDFLQPLMVMLTSGGMGGEGARSAALGIAAYLTKPVRQSELFGVIVNLLGEGRSRAEKSPVRPSETLAGACSGSCRSLKILLAEDQVVNQRVAVGLLGGMGHKVVVVVNGRQAVEACQTKGFDLILMDVQMPVMDGFEAVAAIRAREAGIEGAHRMPIIALTAHAMKGDRERCLDGGFDDYLSKPIRSAEISRIIDRWFGPPSSELTPPSIDSAQKTAGPFNRDLALANLGGDEELLRELLGLFVDDCPRLVAEVEAAVDRSDAPELKRLAHTIRGVAGHFALDRIVDAAGALEADAKAGAWSQARESFENLRQGLDRVIPTLEAVASAPI